MSGSKYAQAGVDVEAGERAVELMRAAVAGAQRPEAMGACGGFAGLFDASALTTYRRPLLATSTDGVGTKVAVAAAMDRHDTIGQDLVAMVVDDLVVCGAEPLFMTDYIACGKVVPERIASIVAGVAKGAQMAGCALLGGETAEHPGLLGPDEYDIAGAGTGVVEADELLSSDRVRAGDVVVAMASSGLHSNGYSLARHVFFEQAGWSLERPVPDFARTLGEELLVPTRIYARDMLVLRDTLGERLHALSHITGGGVAANIARVLPQDVAVDVERGTWTLAPVFTTIGELGDVEREDLEQTFNMGVGMVAVVAKEAAEEAVATLEERGLPAWVCGTVRPRADDEHGDAAAKGGAGGAVSLVGDYT